MKKNLLSIFGLILAHYSTSKLFKRNMKNINNDINKRTFSDQVQFSESHERLNLKLK
ncbi:hypothetical protein JIY74_25405 [Vibrio harveyi]|nr:hypothetical protein [Vibrio harveyi]